ncbi:MAG: hypothetical protein NZ483_08095 [Verrucomicrobiae bacterium]|nr:hypothetical protein [Verrucomicrobiae bacterium]
MNPNSGQPNFIPRSSSHLVRRLARRDQCGQTLFEYAIIIAAVALVVVLVLRGIGEYPPKALNPVNNALAQ